MSLLNSGDGSSPSRLRLDKGKDSRLFAQFKGFIKKEHLFPENSSIIAAVSGGPDSICLLNLLFLLSRPWSLRVGAAHFDHGLRGKESLCDEAFVREVCRQNDIPYFTERADVKAVSRRKGMGIQEAARFLRYDFLRRTAAEQGFTFVATGHTRDDQAEEIIFRLLRGAGPEALAGIRAKRADNVVRPLLFLRKEAILSYLGRHGIPFVSDSSNEELKYTRNRIRKLILPVIEREINPGVVDSLYKTGRIMAEQNQALAAMAREAYELVAVKSNCSTGVVLDRISLLSFHRAVRKRVYKKAMTAAGVPPKRIGFDHLEKMDEIACSERPVVFYWLPAGYFLLRNNDLMGIFGKALRGLLSLGKRDVAFSIAVHGPGRYQLPGDAGEVIIEKMPCGFPEIKRDTFFPRPLFVSLRDEVFPMRITFRKDGDRFSPYGMEKPVRLKKFLINRHVPRFFRDVLPILRTRDEITAVCGVEISKSFRIVPGDETCARITWNPGGLFDFFSTSKALSQAV